jgi:hypothetical protein
MRRHIEVHNSSTIMRNNKEAIEHAKRQGWHGEEVQRGDHFAMIAEKGRPTLGFAFVKATSELLQICRYRDTVGSEISNPNCSNSPWIRGGPQV